MEHLICQIAAPIQSWGNENARRDRPTDRYPRKSAVLGMLGAAAGKTREDPWHRSAADRFGFAAVILRAGHPLSDYQTVLTPRGSGAYKTRSEEVLEADYTIETMRDYVSDAYFMVAFWQDPSKPKEDLGSLVKALEEPVFEIFAGRKCCPLSLPPAPFLADAPTLREAFQAYRKRLYPPLLPKASSYAIYWDPHPSPGISAISTNSRQDVPWDRKRFLYRSRKELAGSIDLLKG
jgi:CRISPR system Cascade subunit CasD